VPARDAADRLASLQGLFDKANLLVVAPSPPTLGAQHIDLHSPRDLKARPKVKSSARLSNYARRPPPEEYNQTRRFSALLLPRLSNYTRRPTPEGYVDAGEHIGEPGLRIDVVELGGHDQGRHDRGTLGTTI